MATTNLEADLNQREHLVSIFDGSVEQAAAMANETISYSAELARQHWCTDQSLQQLTDLIIIAIRRKNINVLNQLRPVLTFRHITADVARQVFEACEGGDAPLAPPLAGSKGSMPLASMLSVQVCDTIDTRCGIA